MAPIRLASSARARLRRAACLFVSGVLSVGGVVASAPDASAASPFLARQIFLPGEDSADVVAIDAVTGAVVATIPVPPLPVDIQVSPDGSRAYVTTTDNAVVQIDTATDTVIRTYDGPTSVSQSAALSPDGRYLYVLQGGGNLTVVDTVTGAVSTILYQSNGGQALIFSEDGTRVYVAGDGLLTFFASATGQFIGQIGLDTVSPTEMQFAPDGHTLWISDADGNVLKLDASNLQTLAVYPVGGYPDGLALSPDSSKVYVSDYNDNTVSVLSSTTGALLSTVPVGDLPGQILTDPQDDAVIVLDRGDFGVSYIDAATDTVMSTLSDPHADFATDLAIAPNPAAPVVTAVTPGSGSVADATSVTLTGTGFTGATAVRFGTVPASAFTVESDTTITATTPAAAASGAVDVMVTTPKGTSIRAPGDRYTYTPDATTMTATPILHNLALSATLTDTTTGTPAANQPITFTVGSTAACTATTNAQGTATCSNLLTLLAALLTGSYTATFSGSSTLAAAHASAGLG